MCYFFPDQLILFLFYSTTNMKSIIVLFVFPSNWSVKQHILHTTESLQLWISIQQQVFGISQRLLHTTNSLCARLPACGSIRRGTTGCHSETDRPGAQGTTKLHQSETDRPGAQGTTKCHQSETDRPGTQTFTICPTHGWEKTMRSSPMNEKINNHGNESISNTCTCIYQFNKIYDIYSKCNMLLIHILKNNYEIKAQKIVRHIIIRKCHYHCKVVNYCMFF